MLHEAGMGMGTPDDLSPRSGNDAAVVNIVDGGEVVVEISPACAFPACHCVCCALTLVAVHVWIEAIMSLKRMWQDRHHRVRCGCWGCWKTLFFVGLALAS